MDINDLCNKLYYHANNMPERGVIINVNIYTTITGAIDNVIEIKKTAESILKKIPYTIHADGSIGGILMPIMKPFQQKVVNYFCDLGINTMSISTQKFLGSVISGIAMVKSDFLKSAFNNDTIEIDYIGNIIDNTIACARSGLNILLIHNALHALNVGIDNSFIRKIYYNNLRNASYLYTELSKLSSPSEVLLLPHSFNVVFNRPSKELMVKYQLMPAFTNKAVICVLQNVTLGLIEEFLKDYKRALSIK
jgi:glutamate/tyrosine decarboxylase-like PLP-dependent enzyme